MRVQPSKCLFMCLCLFLSSEQHAAQLLYDLWLSEHQIVMLAFPPSLFFRYKHHPMMNRPTMSIEKQMYHISNSVSVSVSCFPLVSNHHRNIFSGQNFLFTRFYCNNTLNAFWDNLLRDIEAQLIDKEEEADKYNISVMKLLNDHKKNFNKTELNTLQMEIENLSTKFDEKSVHSETPHLLRLLIGRDLISAKNYLHYKLPCELYNSTISLFGEYTIEAIIIYVIGLLYNSQQDTSVVRLSTLLDVLDTNVRAQAHIIKNKESITVTRPQETKNYIIGINLIQFMKERDLIYFEHMSSDDKKLVVKEEGKGFLKSNLFAVCNFDMRLIPLKLNLPMVCKPLDWEHISTKNNILLIDNIKPFKLSDIVGGYLSSPSFDIYNCFDMKYSLYNRYSLLSSRNLKNFNIELDEGRFKDICQILNGLQNQGFKINKNILDFIKKNRESLEISGLLKPEILTRVNLKRAYDLLRLSYFNNKDIAKAYRLDVLLKEFATIVQTARYEDLIINLASAYEDFVFYLPAFMDFRGRIYRSGILHFHERDLARSLIVFADNPKEGSDHSAKDIIATSAAFKYKKFYHYDDALKWFKENHSKIYASDKSIINYAKLASDQFQFMAKVLSYNREQDYGMLPITQDAAASAYQIMSYFLLNEEMARRTNLIANPDGYIQDVYTYLLHDFKHFLIERIDDKSKMAIIESKLDRKLLKSLFMPLIYGKTMISIERDIKLKYGDLLSRKDTFLIAKLCTEFWKEKYPDIVNFMKLITIISWFCSAQDRGVTYSIPYFTTKQDYMSFIKEEILIYEGASRKRRRVTLNVPTMKRDKRKTQAAACANFIHQKDAYIAMKVVESLLKYGASIYTVHDNFITTPNFVGIVPTIYSDIISNMGTPLNIINKFLLINLIYPNSSCPVSYYCLNHDNPIPSDYLTELLISNTPTKDKKKWVGKVSELVMYYNYYVEAVCGHQEVSSPINNQDKWVNFKKLIENRSFNYSVHY